jgi:glutathione S-transferase
MSITFYTASGSVPAWKVQLILEHKQIPYELKMLSFQDGDFKKPEFLAVNPRGTVPCIRDDDFSLWESSVICEYLEEKSQERPILPRDVRERARIRRITMEILFGIDRIAHDMGNATFMQPGGKVVPEAFDKAREAARPQLQLLEEELRGPFYGGETPSLADFTLYPVLAIIRRITTRFQLEAVALGPRLTDLMKRVEAMPFYDKTYPPHWRG